MIPGNWFGTGSSTVILAAMLSIAFGLLNCFFGYRLFKVLLGIYGFVLGATGGFALAGAVAEGQTLWLVVGMVVGGLVGAAVMVLLYFVGVFVVGAVAGALLASLIGAALNVNLPSAAILVVALAVGLIALALQRTVIILSTAFSGAWGVVSGLASLLTGRAALLLNPINRPGVWHKAGLPLLLVLFLWLVLGVVSAVVQFRTAPQKPRSKARR